MRNTHRLFAFPTRAPTHFLLALYRSSATTSRLKNPYIMSPPESDREAGSGLDSVEDEFPESAIPGLPALPAEQLQQYEETLSREFETLSKEYVESRTSRIAHMLDVIKHHIKVFSDNDKRWAKVYAFEMKTIENIRTNTEDVILAHAKTGAAKHLIESLDEYELELTEMFNNIQSPLDFDHVFGTDSEKLPFEHDFARVTSPFKNALETAKMENKYQTLMVRNNVDTNRAIVWKQYYKDLQGRKEEMIRDTYAQLAQLHREYLGVSENDIRAKDLQHYYRSVISTANIKDHLAAEKSAHNNNDTFHDSNNTYYKKNRIELTNAKNSIWAEMLRHSSAQNRGSDPGTHLRLASCLGLDEGEIESDLLALKQPLSAQGQHEAYDDMDIDDYESDGSMGSEKSEDELSLKYRLLLKLKAKRYVIRRAAYETTSYRLRLPKLPPIGSFPEPGVTEA